MSTASRARDIAIAACAISAGVHGALAPEHVREGAGPGIGFVASAAMLAVLAIALTRRLDGVVWPVATTIVMAGLLLAYALALTTGIPLLHPEVEQVERVAVATKVVETAGLLAALSLVRGGRVTPASIRSDLRGVIQ